MALPDHLSAANRETMAVEIAIAYAAHVLGETADPEERGRMWGNPQMTDWRIGMCKRAKIDPAEHLYTYIAPLADHLQAIGEIDNWQN